MKTALILMIGFCILIGGWVYLVKEVQPAVLTPESVISDPDLTRIQVRLDRLEKQVVQLQEIVGLTGPGVRPEGLQFKGKGRKEKKK